MRIKSTLGKKTVQAGEFGACVRLADITSTHPMSNAEHTVRDIHDILQSYYKVALKRFSDNLCMQAVDYYLVTGPESPLRVFSPDFVFRLTEEKLEEIAGEDEVTKRRRALLEKKVANLEAAKKHLT